MSKERPRRPQAVSRQLRQEAGFGCCKCGLPIYQYHHIVPYHEDDPYPPEEMMILCPNDHDAVTKGAIPLPEQWHLKADPYNRRAGHVRGLLAINQRHSAVSIGGTLIVGEDAFIDVAGERLLSIGLDHPSQTLKLSLTIYDDDDNLLVKIVDSEWVAGDPMPWDIESDYQLLKIRRKSRDVVLDVDARQQPVEVSAKLTKNGQHVRLTPEGISWESDGGGGVAELGLVGFGISVDLANAQVRLIPDPRFPHGMLISERVFEERVRKSVAAWDEIVARMEREIGRNGKCWCGSGLKLKRCHGA